MRIYASGIGRTLDEAMVKVRAELATAALHVSELRPKEVVPGVMAIDPNTARVANPLAREIEDAVTAVAGFVQPLDGYAIRVLVVLNADGEASSGKVEVDLVRA